MNAEAVAASNANLPGDNLNATLITSGLSVIVLVGLFYYLNRYTRRRYFTIWTAGWLFYGWWLSLYFSWVYAPQNPLWIAINNFSVGAAASFLLWGSAAFLNQKAPQSLFGAFLAFLAVWSYVSAFHFQNDLLSQTPVFGLLAAASVFNGISFFRLRERQNLIGAGLLSLGFFIWSLHLCTFPFWQRNTLLLSAGFGSAAVIQLFIAVSMIVLVLEEVRVANDQAIRELETRKSQTERLRAKVLSTEERYRSLFDQASEGIIIAEAASFRILEMNQTAERLLGVTRDESPPLLSTVCQLPTGYKGEKNGSNGDWLATYRGQLRVVRRDGQATIAEMDGAPIQFEGQPAYQFFLRELTERVRLEQQLRQAEKLSALGRMISGVAHELNNPLAVIKGYVELILARHELAAPTRTDLEKVAHESNRAAKLVSNFLSFAREQPVNRQLVDLNQLVGSVVEQQKAELDPSATEVILDLQPHVPRFRADPDQVEQLLVNLIANARQALTGLPQRRIKIITQTAPNLVRVLVEDSGPGVPDHLLSHIFEPFFTTKEVGSGTGLGLSIAHSIMTDHQGRIYYQPASLGGAGFVLEFPVMQENISEPARTADKPVPTEKTPSQPARARILVLDDEQSLGELLGQLLEVVGHSATLCQSGLKALELIEKQDFDLVLSDFRMPLMDGQQFYYALKARKPELASRIIFLTGDVVSEDTRTFLKSTGNPHLVKPFNMESVEKLVNKVLAEAKPVAH